MDNVTSAVDAVMTAFNEFKATNDQRLSEIERKGTSDVLVREKLERIEGTLSAFEGMNQRLTLAEAKAKAIQDVDDRLAAIEAKAGRPGAGGGDRGDYKNRTRQWMRALFNAHTMGHQALSLAETKALDDAAIEWKALSNSNDTGAGYLAPIEVVNEIIKGVTEISPVRSLVRVRSTVNKSIMQPVRNGQFAARWVGETETRTETTGLAFGMEEIPTHEMYAMIDISRQNLDDSAYDMEGELRTESIEQFALAEGTAVVSGTGSGRPEGWMSNTSVATTNSGAAAAVTADGLLTLKHAIKTAYAANATFVFNRTTLGSIRKLKTTGGDYVWMPGIAMGKPNTIDGDPYVEMPDMPSEGAGLKPVAYGDFRRAYVLVDRIGMNMIRDNLTQATSGNVRFHFFRRMGGQVVLAEAIRTLTCST